MREEGGRSPSGMEPHDGAAGGCLAAHGHSLFGAPWRGVPQHEVSPTPLPPEQSTGRRHGEAKWLVLSVGWDVQYDGQKTGPLTESRHEEHARMEVRGGESTPYAVGHAHGDDGAPGVQRQAHLGQKGVRGAPVDPQFNASAGGTLWSSDDGTNIPRQGIGFAGIDSRKGRSENRSVRARASPPSTAADPHADISLRTECRPKTS